MASWKLFLQSAFLLFVFDLSFGGEPCLRRKYKEDSIVCVCTEEYCDTIDPVTAAPQGVVQIFESDRTIEKRLDRRTQDWNGPDNPEGDQTWNVQIDRSRTYQEIVGFGGAFSDAAALTIGSLSPNLQRTLMRAYYSDQGIEYNMGRAVISGCDFSTRAYTYDDSNQDDWALTGFRFFDEDLNYKIPLMKLAKEVAKYDVKLFASSWSPPAWMKTNGQLEGAGTLKEGPGSRTWETYAQYLIKYLDGYKNLGIDFWGMTVQNEPNTGFSPGYPWMTCGFTAQMEHDFIKQHLGPNLARAGYTPDRFNVIILDHNRDIVLNWTDTILGDPETAAMVKGTGLHWYLNWAAEPEVYDQVKQRYPNHFLLATEACVRHWDDVIGLGGWYMAEMYAHDIMIDLTHSVGGWVDWNLAVDMQGGPNYVSNFHSAPIIINAGAGEFYKNTQYYAMAHFSKFLPPGSVRMGTSPEMISNDDFKMVVFRRPDDGIAVVVINSYEQDQVVVLSDPIRGVVRIKVGSRSFNTFLYH